MSEATFRFSNDGKTIWRREAELPAKTLPVQDLKIISRLNLLSKELAPTRAHDIGFRSDMTSEFNSRNASFWLKRQGPAGLSIHYLGSAMFIEGYIA